MEASSSEIQNNGVQYADGNPIPVTTQKEELAKTQASWATLVAGNKYASKGMTLTFIAPVIENGEKIVELQRAEVAKGTEKWNKAVILYVVGEDPSIGAIERFIASEWNFVSKPTIYYHNEGYFVIKLNTLEERNEVLYSGPYTLRRKPVIIKAWTPEFNFHEEVLKTIPVWVKLPNIPLNCWENETLSRIGSSLGIPIYADDCTSKVDHISYARILVEMDITQPLLDKVKLKDPERKLFEQIIAYEWKPMYCGVCLMLGHDCNKGQQQNAPRTQPQMIQQSPVKEIQKPPQQQRKKNAPRKEWKSLEQGVAEASSNQGPTAAANKGYEQGEDPLG
ncbi:uncharacterized protein LOC132637115 [Lycium barbarum]|uniref:uncharacterized protein LOC132637115 n=1 Tax=Lycium barbarum TaxID=112863 RepID=UPI00293E4602|nr:uncharacterized protein LOC132637115 [Lycium barbarum]